jgi:hypothetical protein
MKGFKGSANAARESKSGHVVPTQLIFEAVQAQSVESLMLLLILPLPAVVFPFRVDELFNAN